MPVLKVRKQLAALALVLSLGLPIGTARAIEPSTAKRLPAAAYVVPKETATEGEGYFSIIEGLNRRLYVGTHANAVNSWLVEFDPAARKMEIAVDAHKAIGKDVKGFGAQSKIHTRNNVGASGKIYFGTKQGYAAKGEKYTDYPGGYPMVYDPSTRTTKVYPIPVPHQGIISVTPDESRGVAYISTCSDGQPGPGEIANFMILDLKTEKYRQIMETKHIFGFIVIDHLGRAYHPILGGDIARFTPAEKGGIEGGKLERLKQTIDGKAPTAETRLALTTPGPDPINWDITPDGKTLYSQPLGGNALYAYDLTATGDTLPGRKVGVLIPGAKEVDCRAMCVGPTGTCWCAITERTDDGHHWLHVVRYGSGDKAPMDLGVPAVTNPDFTEFTGKDGEPLPFHGGFVKLKDGATTTHYVVLGVCEARDGTLSVLALHPYSIVQIAAKHLH